MIVILSHILYLLVCHVPFPAQGAVRIIHRAGNHMTDQQIYFSGWPRFVHTCLGLIYLFWRYFYLKFENLKKGQNFVPDSKCFRCMYNLYPTINALGACTKVPDSKMLQVHVKFFVPECKCFRRMKTPNIFISVVFANIYTFSFIWMTWWWITFVREISCLLNQIFAKANPFCMLSLQCSPLYLSIDLRHIWGRILFRKLNKWERCNL